MLPVVDPLPQKPETRNPKPPANVSFNRRNPKPETDSESWFQATKPQTRNPKPETDSESWLQPTKPETRNPKPETRNPKPETRNRIRLLGGSPDRNSCFATCQMLRGLIKDITGLSSEIHMRTDANNLVTTASTIHVPEQQETIHSDA